MNSRIGFQKYQLPLQIRVWKHGWQTGQGHTGISFKTFPSITINWKLLQVVLPDIKTDNGMVHVISKPVPKNTWLRTKIKKTHPEKNIARKDLSSFIALDHQIFQSGTRWQKNFVTTTTLPGPCSASAAFPLLLLPLLLLPPWWAHGGGGGAYEVGGWSPPGAWKSRNNKGFN